jgi:hypothetical protein
MPMSTTAIFFAWNNVFNFDPKVSNQAIKINYHIYYMDDLYITYEGNFEVNCNKLPTFSGMPYPRGTVNDVYLCHCHHRNYVHLQVTFPTTA